MKMLIENPPKITLSDLKLLGQRAKGGVTQLYLHWTAGHYGQAYDDYHLNIDRDGEIYQTCRELYEARYHTYLRNTRSVGIALCCGYGATLDGEGRIDFGPEPPTPVQIEKTAQVVAALAHALELEINFSTVKTHAEAAFMDGYGPGSGDKDVRWDLWLLPDLPLRRTLRPGGLVIRGKALWYGAHYAEKASKNAQPALAAA